MASVAFEELLALVETRLGATAVQRVTHAFEFAMSAHGETRRASGELYVEHDLAVATITAELGVDISVIVGSLLHDILLAHTHKKVDDVQAGFGKNVTDLVVSMKNLYAYTEGDRYRQQQANANGEALENVRGAILSVIKGDIHVILIRMADCLHDLRRASQLSEAKRLEIAREVKNIYAPLANRLGIWQIKWELEDLSFRYLQPEEYQEIAKQLAARRVERSLRVEAAVIQLQRRLREEGLQASVTGRAKHIYSIYRKMQQKKLTFDQIYDVQALRVIIEPTNPDIYKNKNQRQKDLEDRAVCYQVLAIVHELWRAVPGEFDDYISTPKENGYRSLHTAVLDSATGQTLEVQIRTMRMHEEAEKGIASHWAYKEDGEPGVSARKRVEKMRAAVAQLLESDAADSEIFETEVAAERFHVFTPRGDVFDLPVGSTPIDFAYQIHTEVGHRCRGARVNGKMVSLDHRLKSGDQVEIITAKRGGPSRDWMNSSLGYTGSARTRSKIRQWFREQEREQNILQGREAVTRELKRLGLLDTFSIADIAQGLHFSEEENFLAKVGFGDIQSNQISGAISLLKRDLEPDDEIRPLLQPQPARKGLTVQGLSGLATKMAGCCNPIAPEPIVGYITRGHGITIHRRDCKTIEAIDEQERLIEVSWGEEVDRYPVPIVVKAYRSPNLIENIVATFRGRNINVPKTKTVTSGSTMTVYLVVEVATLNELNWLLQKLESTQNVIEANRQRWH